MQRLHMRPKLTKPSVSTSSSASTQHINQVNKTEYNPEQLAKFDLIEISHNDYINKTQDKELDFDLEFNCNERPIQKIQKVQATTHRSKFIRNTKNDFWNRKGDDILKELKKFTVDINMLHRRDNNVDFTSEKSFHLGDNFVSIAVRNPLAVSHYLTSGSMQTASLPKKQSMPPISQYVIRQQRNVSRLKKEKQKNETVSFRYMTRKQAPKMQHIVSFRLNRSEQKLML